MLNLSFERAMFVRMIAVRIATQEYARARRLGYSATEAEDISLSVVRDIKEIATHGA